MEQKIMLIAVIKKNDKVLMRKKLQVQDLYTESWYLLGAALDASTSDIPKFLMESILEQTGLIVTIEQTSFWDWEIKKDHDKKEKLFVYLDCICRYISGKVVPQRDVKLEWVPVAKLKEYDLVPPSRKLFQKLGWLKQ